MSVPSILQLESRRLLTVSVQWDGQDGADLVGLNSDVGPDGAQDIHLLLTNLKSVAGTTAIQSIVIQGPPGFQWEYNNGAQSSGWANAEFFFPYNNPGDWSQGDLYLNPTVDSNLSSSQQPLGSSTGSPITLQNGNVLNLTVTYSNQTTDTGSITVASLASPPLTMSPIPTPGNIVTNAFAVSWSQFSNNGQDGTYQGDVHLSVSGLNGKAISSATLSDQAGCYWSSADTSGHYNLMVNDPSNSNTADLYFPPIRDETVCAPGISAAADMTLRLTFSGDTTDQYVTQFAGGPWNPALVANQFNSNSETVSTASALAAALETQPGTTEYDTITVAATTITLTQPLEMNHSVHIIGQNATLNFEATWSSSVPGAMYVDPNTRYNTDLLFNFQNLNIEFDTSYHNTWYDPEKSGNNYAVVNFLGTNNSPVVVQMSYVSITGPPALDPTPSGLPSGHTYAGEPATNLILTQANSGWTQSSGSITYCALTGGPVTLAGGPWQITHNIVDGALASTYSPAAFALTGSHDVTLEYNTVTQVASTGTEFRLINIHSNDFNDIVANNSFTGGQIGNEMTYSAAGSGSYQGINDPEIVLPEGYGVDYEGMVGAVSADGWLLSLPMPSSSVSARGFGVGGPGAIVSIVNTLNTNGTPNPNADKWFMIAQQVSSSPPTFLMQSPIPTGNYVVSVASGFVDDQYLSNTIDIASKSSTGMSLPGNQFGTTIENNTIVGGGTYQYPYTGTAILLQAAGSNPSPALQSDPSGTEIQPTGYQFPMPRYWTEAPSFGVTIASNTFENSPGGVLFDVALVDRESSTGRVYLTATVESNTFQWTSNWLSAWGASPAPTDTTFYGILNGSNNLANAAADNSRPPTITVGSGFSAAVRIPATVGGAQGYIDPQQVNLTISGNTAEILPTSGSPQILAEPTGQVYAGIINGVVSPTSPFPYNQPSYSIAGNPTDYAPYDADNLNINPYAPSSQVDLGLNDNAVGITTDDNTGPGSLDSPGDSLSAAALAISTNWTSGQSDSWGGQTFALGTPGVNDIVQFTGQTITLPSGQDTDLMVLALAHGSIAECATFTVNYTSGSPDTFEQVISDAVNGFDGSGTTAPGESIAAAMDHYNTQSGPRYGSTVYLYAYDFSIDPSRSVVSVTLSSNNAIALFALDIVNRPAQVSLSGSFNRTGIYNDESPFSQTGGLDGGGYAYSANLLGSSVTRNGQTFDIGQAGASDVVSANGQTIPLLAGNDTQLMFLATAVDGNQVGLTFTVNYSDGSSAQFTQSFSDWFTPQTYSGESKAVIMGYRDTSAGGTDSRTFYLYGYSRSLDSSKTVESITLPTDTDLEILAIDVISETTKPMFLGQDTTTQGNWVGAYGAQGYDALGYTASLPSYATVTPANDTFYTWSSSTTDTRALQDPANPTGSRVSACWYSTNNTASFTVDVNLTDGQVHELALYLLDWPNAGRTETAQISDAATGTVLDSKTVSSFNQGVYLRWNVSGHIMITLTKAAGPSAVLSGLFLDPPPPAATASFLKQDAATKGNWVGTYGAQGYDALGYTAGLPSYATVTPTGDTPYTWSPSTTDTRALQDPANPSGSRVSACWFSPNTTDSFTVDVNLTDGQSHDLALYLLDWTNSSRQETVEISDAVTGTILDTEPVSSFNNGIYLQWEVSGHIVITLTRTASASAVLSGLFLDPPPVTGTATFVKQDTTTKGNWVGTYGAQGYNALGYTASVPSYASVIPSNTTYFTWSSSTTDTRALQNPVNPTGSRVSACWYSTNNTASFTVDVNLTDGQTHDLALYLLDWPNAGRVETVQISDAVTGTVLDSETVSSFNNGIYLQWEVSGSIVITLTKTAGPSAVLSGLFFDPAGLGMQSMTMIASGATASGPVAEHATSVSMETTAAVGTGAAATVSAIGRAAGVGRASRAIVATVAAATGAGIGRSAPEISPLAIGALDFGGGDAGTLSPSPDSSAIVYGLVHNVALEQVSRDNGRTRIRLGFD